MRGDFSPTLTLYTSSPPAPDLWTFLQFLITAVIKVVTVWAFFFEQKCNFKCCGMAQNFCKQLLEWNQTTECNTNSDNVWQHCNVHLWIAVGFIHLEIYINKNCWKIQNKILKRGKVGQHCIDTHPSVSSSWLFRNTKKSICQRRIFQRCISKSVFSIVLKCGNIAPLCISGSSSWLIVTLGIGIPLLPTSATPRYLARKNAKRNICECCSCIMKCT